ncbi:hypothetical protein CU254_14710 [Amycolatopsis sp. AA4]|uniref:DUF5403 family protein n=1 Tax=Actinomycetes TaxID=1760 RepID=UPI0001B54AD9|nr:MULTISPECIES: DUF5403 family protein [Actinomycetes]ATY11569.1 hypothetical protein CU254_14710 [Amycolatopsis sp. AA4]EFL07212.1 hypothetical protein SSMG_02883 [Streptomyces sp. AA4]
MKHKTLPNLERVVAHSAEVEQVLGDEAYGVLVAARGNLARHHRTGKTRVTQTKGRVDHYVNLDAGSLEASLSIEEGHVNARTGEWVEGLHILRDALRGA